MVGEGAAVLREFSEHFLSFRLKSPRTIRGIIDRGEGRGTERQRKEDNYNCKIIIKYGSAKFPRLRASHN